MSIIKEIRRMKLSELTPAEYNPRGKAYPEEFQDKVIGDAEIIGLVKAANINGIAPQILIIWCKKRGISFRKNSEKKSCVVCGKMFPVKPSCSGNRKCCSRECRAVFENENRCCLFCGNEFEVIKSSKRKYCSHECYAKSNRKDDLPKKRRGSNWNTIRRRFKSTPQLCRLCQTNTATDLHHIIPFNRFDGDWERANHPSNLIPLCKKCHVKAEKRAKEIFNILENFNSQAVQSNG